MKHIGEENKTKITFYNYFIFHLTNQWNYYTIFRNFINE